MSHRANEVLHTVVVQMLGAVLSRLASTSGYGGGPRGVTGGRRVAGASGPTPAQQQRRGASALPKTG